MNKNSLVLFYERVLYILIGKDNRRKRTKLVAGELGIIVYGALCYLLKIEEVRDAVDKLEIRL